MTRFTPPFRPALWLALAATGALAQATPTTAAPAAAAASAPRPALTVAVQQPQPRNWARKLAANGNLAAWQEASIGAETAGLRLAEVRAQVGDRVRKGQVLALLASDTLRAETAQARAVLAEAQAAEAEAVANAARARELSGSGALSAAQISQYLTGEQTARARVESARALLDLQQTRLAQAQVLAPDDGVISARGATVGAVVNPGTELFRLIRKGRLEWRAEVTAAELGRLAPGTPATVTAASGAQLQGRLRTLGPTVDPQTRQALVYVDVTPAPDTPRLPALPGMFARGEFAFGSGTALTLPQTAVVMRDGFSHVFRLEAGERVALVKVRTGRTEGDRVELLAGVTAADRIVTSGAGFLNDGDRVRVAAAAPATAAAPVASGPAAAR
jgi:RND family efflux transporter MFP subunit